MPRLTEAEDQRVCEVLGEIAEKVQKRRIMMYQYFKDFDRVQMSDNPLNSKKNNKMFLKDSDLVKSGSQFTTANEITIHVQSTLSEGTLSKYILIR